MVDSPYKASEIIREILENDPKARDSDNILYYKVLQKVGLINGIDIESMPIPRFFLHMKDYGFPQFETVRRTRQKLQHDYPELGSSKEIAEYRQKKEKKYHEYFQKPIERG